MKKIVTTTLLLAFFFAFSQQKTIDQKIDALLKQMTLEEKIGQLNQYSGDFTTTGPVTIHPNKINEIKNGTVGWTDWNILLDQNGGPNHVGNFCFAPIHADTNSGELIYTPSYYYIGHFSKFIRVDAKRVSTSVSRSDLLSTSFLNVDGKMVTVVMNQTNKSVTYNLIVASEKTVVVIPAHGIQTLVY